MGFFFNPHLRICLLIIDFEGVRRPREEEGEMGRGERKGGRNIDVREKQLVVSRTRCDQGLNLQPRSVP